MSSFKWIWKGILKKMYKIPALRRLLNDPNIKKLVKCSCWPKALVPNSYIKMVSWPDRQLLWVNFVTRSYHAIGRYVSFLINFEPCQKLRVLQWILTFINVWLIQIWWTYTSFSFTGRWLNTRQREKFPSYHVNLL